MDRRNCREVSPRYFFLTPDDEVLTRRREIFFCGAEFGHFYDCLPISQMWRTFASLELEEYFFCSRCGSRKRFSLLHPI